MKHQTEIKKAVSYARFSSDLQREESIDAQLRAIDEWAKRNNIIITGKYIDRAMSGTTDKRPEFQRMIADSKQKKFDFIIVHKLDRFTRDRYDSIFYKRELKRNGVTVRSVLENLDDSPESIILESVLTGFNEYYSKNLAREVEKGKKENALKARHVGGKPPFGYDLDRDTMRLVLNESEAEGVKYIFKSFLEGVGYTEMIDTLNRNGYRQKSGTKFKKNTIHHLLKQEKYTGVYIYGKSAPKDVDGRRNGHKYKPREEWIIVPDGCPQIISKEDFETVQRIMGSRKRAGSGASSVKYDYLLTGKLVCGVCGSAFVGCGRKERDGHPEFISYRCHKKNGSIKCKNPEISRDNIEIEVIKNLALYIFDDYMINSILGFYDHYLEELNSGTNVRRKKMEEGIAKLGNDIEFTINAMITTNSLALSDKLKEMESQRELLKVELDTIQGEIENERIPEQVLIDHFHESRRLFEEGKLPSMKKIINTWLDKVLIFPDHLEIILNPGLTPNRFHYKLPETIIEFSDKTKKQQTINDSLLKSDNCTCQTHALIGGEGGI